MSDIVREICDEVAVKERQEAKAEAVEMIQLNMGLSLQEACRVIGITVEEYNMAKGLVVVE